MGEILVDRRKVGINVAGSARISRSAVPHLMFHGIGYISSRKFAAPTFYLWAWHVSGGDSPSASAPAFTGNSTERIANRLGDGDQLPIQWCLLNCLCSMLRLRLLIVPVLSENGDFIAALLMPLQQSKLQPEQPKATRVSSNQSCGGQNHSIRHRSAEYDIRFRPLRLLSFTEWISPGAGGPETGGSDSGRRTHSSNVPQGRKAKTPPTLVGALIAGCARD
ncbi:uncharacterized protein CCOS01_10141 [Colletotrichum costaricense]|uniref:Uncharacterized protein n=1 Tax=Colletotrichum costaricense TaxID=1209916 RepID=A0AAJ0DZ83_9PEZI|nr:uncharacterized protein CCOS01_10141 [Colletotrichum costaricense]KAK1522429.1 hypothetical protein CCOS01_10141 [Colletotrichum costaricense]